jgi:sec-independent protein translocase protein TatA
MFGGIGMQEILIVLIIGLLVFGATRLPKIARSLGLGIKEFKKTIKGIDEDEDEGKIKYVQNQPPVNQQYQQYNPGMQNQAPPQGQYYNPNQPYQQNTGGTPPGPGQPGQTQAQPGQSWPNQPQTGQQGPDQPPNWGGNAAQQTPNQNQPPQPPPDDQQKNA